MKLGMQVGLGPGHIVLDDDDAYEMGTQLLPKKGAEPPPPLKFSAHVYCGQTVGWIKMPLGMEVGLDPSEIVLWEPSFPPKRGAQPSPNFRHMSLVPNAGAY